MMKVVEKKVRNLFSYDSQIMDTVLKFLPLVVLAAADGRSKTRHNWKQQMLLSTIILLGTNAVVKPLKRIVGEQRPWPSLKQDSFPSGHTAAAFAEAEIVRQELNNKTSIVKYAGYGVAVALGMLRIFHHKHKPIDVVTGAAIGIISSCLAYKILPEQSSH
jgi:membrane-associated phospholipid phosphatase